MGTVTLAELEELARKAADDKAHHTAENEKVIAEEKAAIERAKAIL